jgi:hypothetical protein
MPPLENGLLLTKDPGAFMPPDASGLRRYIGGNPALPSWNEFGELNYAYSSHWDCREAQDYIPSDCNILPLIQYFESQGWSVYGQPWFILDDGHIAVRIQIGMPLCRPSAIAKALKQGYQTCGEFSS